MLVEHGAHQASLVELHAALTAAGAVVHFVGPRVGLFVDDAGGGIEADKSMENAPAVLFDALVVPDGTDAVQALAGNGQAIDFVKDMFRHCKSMLALGAGRELLEKAGIGPELDADPGLLRADASDVAAIASAFIDAIAAHRHLDRDSDPPPI